MNELRQQASLNYVQCFDFLITSFTKSDEASWSCPTSAEVACFPTFIPPTQLLPEASLPAQTPSHPHFCPYAKPDEASWSDPNIRSYSELLYSTPSPTRQTSNTASPRGFFHLRKPHQYPPSVPTQSPTKPLGAISNTPMPLETARDAPISNISDPAINAGQRFSLQAHIA